jgi:predicted RNA-binding protein with PIN domain
MHQDMGVFAVNTINADDRRAKFIFPLAEYRDFQRKNKQVLFAAHS